MMPDMRLQLRWSGTPSAAPSQRLHAPFSASYEPSCEEESSVARATVAPALFARLLLALLEESNPDASNNRATYPRYSPPTTPSCRAMRPNAPRVVG